MKKDFLLKVHIIMFLEGHFIPHLEKLPEDTNISKWKILQKLQKTSNIQQIIFYSIGTFSIPLQPIMVLWSTGKWVTYYHITFWIVYCVPIWHISNLYFFDHLPYSLFGSSPLSTLLGLSPEERCLVLVWGVCSRGLIYHSHSTLYTTPLM